MSGDIPQWAMQRAADLSRNSMNRMLDAFARYIAEHEQAPVDPLVSVFDAMGLIDPAWSGTQLEIKMFHQELAKHGLKIVESSK